jgi:hypothetical protein
MSLARYLSDDKPINNQPYVPHFRQRFSLEESRFSVHFSAACNSCLAAFSREDFGSEVVYYSHASVAVLMLQHVLVDTLQLCVIFCVTAKLQISTSIPPPTA